MVLDEERKPPNKNKRPRPWRLEIKYLRGIGVKWGWRKMGMYRTEAEATKAGDHFKRNWHNEMDVRVTNTTSPTSK